MKWTWTDRILWVDVVVGVAQCVLYAVDVSSLDEVEERLNADHFLSPQHTHATVTDHHQRPATARRAHVDDRPMMVDNYRRRRRRSRWSRGRGDADSRTVDTATRRRQKFDRRRQRDSTRRSHRGGGVDSWPYGERRLDVRVARVGARAAEHGRPGRIDPGSTIPSAGRTASLPQFEMSQGGYHGDIPACNVALQPEVNSEIVKRIDSSDVQRFDESSSEKDSHGSRSTPSIDFYRLRKYAVWLPASVAHAQCVPDCRYCCGCALTHSVYVRRSGTCCWCWQAALIRSVFPPNCPKARWLRSQRALGQFGGNTEFVSKQFRLNKLTRKNRSLVPFLCSKVDAAFLATGYTHPWRIPVASCDNFSPKVQIAIN